MSQRKYDPQLKQEVIESVMEGSKPAAQVARDYGIKESTVYTWIKSYKRQNDQARLKLKNETPDQELKRLRAEVRQLKLERDILKKATAYFASLEAQSTHG